ncbi:hypothetical protein SO802_010363 [Lithocarpus litseifolius]|uniref:Rapid ALkalinization Factor n=1 Tax=Lithocarpus litseifolius TaxID=425828 RepID=A0AAW2DEL9_9ROSI
MEAYNNRKGGVYLLAFLAILILSAYCCSSAVLVESNSTSPCNGGVGECQLLEDDMDFPMNPYIRRRLYELGPSNKALKPGEPALSPCGKSKDPTRYCPQQNCNARSSPYYRVIQCQ